jgi:hypothetical protein
MSHYQERESSEEECYLPFDSGIAAVVRVVDDEACVGSSVACRFVLALPCPARGPQWLACRISRNWYCFCASARERVRQRFGRGLTPRAMCLPIFLNFLRVSFQAVQHTAPKHARSWSTGHGARCLPFFLFAEREVQSMQLIALGRWSKADKRWNMVVELRCSPLGSRSSVAHPEHREAWRQRLKPVKPAQAQDLSPLP